MQKLEEQLEPDFDQALALRNSIIPDAIIWYTGEVEGLEFLGEEDEGDEDDDEVDEEDGDDDDDDDKEDKQKKQPVFNFKPPGAVVVSKDGAAAATGTEQPPECKQS